MTEMTEMVKYVFLTISVCIYTYHELQLLKAYRIKFQKFAAHAHKDALIDETFIPT